MSPEKQNPSERVNSWANFFRKMYPERTEEEIQAEAQAIIASAANARMRSDEGSNIKKERRRDWKVWYSNFWNQRRGMEDLWYKDWDVLGGEIDEEIEDAMVESLRLILAERNDVSSRQILPYNDDYRYTHWRRAIDYALHLVVHDRSFNDGQQYCSTTLPEWTDWMIRDGHKLPDTESIMSWTEEMIAQGFL